MKTKAKPKHKRGQADTRERLLKAALDIFAKQGYDAATTRGIAKKAGVNESLIHRYFESKFGLFTALTKQFRENMLSQFLSYERSESLQEELSRFLKFRLQYSRKDKKFFRLSLSRSILDPKVREDIQNFATKAKPPELIERFGQFQRQGQIDSSVNVDSVVSIIQIFAFGLAILVDAIECVTIEDAETLIQDIATILTRGLS